MRCKIYGLLLNFSMDRLNLFVQGSCKLAPGNGTSYLLKKRFGDTSSNDGCLSMLKLLLAGVLTFSPPGRGPLATHGS